jgi:phosphatidylserine/phosphatidylglycerophosphate/cardiolipin synthase-like enzyme
MLQTPSQILRAAFYAAFGLAFALGLLVAIGVLTSLQSRAEPMSLDGASVEVAFAPGDAAPKLVAAAIGEARSTVRVMTYQLSSGRVINALRAAAGRGVDVRVIIDGETCGTKRLAPVLVLLAQAGVQAGCDYRERIHHNKVVVVDASTVVTGSFNFSKGAERNAENVVVLRNVPALAARFLAIWSVHQAHAEPRRG